MIPAPPLALSQSSDFVTACYIVAFSLFILGIRQGTHPRTARSAAGTDGVHYLPQSASPSSSMRIAGSWVSMRASAV